MATQPALTTPETLNLTAEPLGLLALAIFILAYALVVLEETTHMRKSKPVLVAAGLIWALIGLSYSAAGQGAAANAAAPTPSSSMASCSCSCWSPSPTSIRWKNGGCSTCCATGSPAWD